MTATLIAQLLTTLSLAATNARILPAVAPWLTALAALLERGDDIIAELTALNDQVGKMVQEDRPPTADEWAALRGASDTAHETIQSVDLSDPDE